MVAKNDYCGMSDLDKYIGYLIAIADSGMPIADAIARMERDEAEYLAMSRDQGNMAAKRAELVKEFFEKAPDTPLAEHMIAVLKQRDMP